MAVETKEVHSNRPREDARRGQRLRRDSMSKSKTELLVSLTMLEYRYLQEWLHGKGVTEGDPKQHKLRVALQRKFNLKIVTKS